MVFMTWYSKTLEGKGLELNRSVKMMLKLVGHLCPQDEVILTTELGKMPGVKSVELNLDNNRLLVSFDMAKTSVDKIAYRVSQLGYRYVKRA
jgi:copper chaperone CopZ